MQRQQYLIVSAENRDRVVRLVKKLMEQRRSVWLTGLLNAIHPKNLADLWDLFDESEQDHIISILDEEVSAELLTELGVETRTEIFRSKSTEWIAERIEEMDPDDAVDILKEIGTREVNFILRKFDPEYSEEIKELLHYPEETAGALMTSDFLAVNKSARVENIVKTFRKLVEEDEMLDIHFIYVVDRQDHLLGYIPLRKLILELPTRKASEIMMPVPVTVTPEMDQEAVARIFRNFNIISLAVVDDENVLLGRITVDDIVDVLEKESREDIYQMMGLNKNMKFSDSIAVSFKRRLPWMLVNLITTSLGALVVSLFQNTLSHMVMLTVFMPMVAALGGATGNQMVVMIVRGLSSEELHFKALRRVFVRDVLAVALGASLIGLLVGGVAWYISGNQTLAWVIFFSLLGNMVFATVMGIGFPLILRLLRQDPALGSSILVSAATDMMGFFIFLALASALLQA